jgi:hypothetical protein
LVTNTRLAAEHTAGGDDTPLAAPLDSIQSNTSSLPKVMGELLEERDNAEVTQKLERLSNNNNLGGLEFSKYTGGHEEDSKEYYQARGALLDSLNAY